MLCIESNSCTCELLLEALYLNSPSITAKSRIYLESSSLSIRQSQVTVGYSAATLPDLFVQGVWRQDSAPISVFLIFGHRRSQPPKDQAPHQSHCLHSITLVVASHHVPNLSDVNLFCVLFLRCHSLLQSAPVHTSAESGAVADACANTPRVSRASTLQ